MKHWMTGLLLLLFLAGCTDEKKPLSEVHFSVLIPQPTEEQTVRYAEEIQIFSSVIPASSAVSAIVVNNPILSSKEAVIALAIENLSGKNIEIKWDKIRFFHPKNIIKLLPVGRVSNYFEQPDRCKPLLGREAFKEQLRKYGVLREKNTTEIASLGPAERALAEVYRDIKKDLCYTKLPNDTSLEPGRVTVGYLVIQLPKENFRQKTFFMLKIPIGGKLHKLRYLLQPME
ncbi:hypothetical protein [Hydrogenimonas sp.]